MWQRCSKRFIQRPHAACVERAGHQQHASLLAGALMGQTHLAVSQARMFPFISQACVGHVRQRLRWCMLLNISRWKEGPGQQHHVSSIVIGCLIKKFRRVGHKQQSMQHGSKTTAAMPTAAHWPSCRDVAAPQPRYHLGANAEILSHP